jgi:prolyl-tRNA synthetase
MRFYQVVNTFRYETKHTRPLIRVREITTFKEAHTVHSTRQEAQEQVKMAVKIYSKFFDQLGIPYVITRRPDWDKFPGAEYTMAFDTLLPDGKTLQIATVHNLGQTFAKTFDITYENEEGAHEYVYQTCYGVSDRVIASIIGIHGDQSGLVLPPMVAPIQVVIVPIIFKKGAEEVLNFCRNLEEKLKNASFRVELDERDLRAGRKFYEWEMKGVPLRLEIGPRDLKENNIVFSTRDNQKKEIQDYEDENIINQIREKLENITQNLKEKGWFNLNENIRPVNSLEEARKTITTKMGIISFSWCGDESCGNEIEEKIHVDILGVQDEEDHLECINCGKKSKYKTLMARTY